MTSIPKRAYSAAEEWLNSISHGLACVAAIVGCGEVPLTQAMQSLQQAGYSGRVSLCNHQTRDPMRALLRNRRFVNQLATQLTGA